MELGSILLGLAMVILAVAYVTRPLSSRAETALARGHLSTLDIQRDRVLEALQELELDHAMGKVLELDYLHQRQALALRGARVLRQIDELQESSPTGGALEDQLEVAIARLRVKPGRVTGVCHNCGSRVLPDDRYCSSCGAEQEESGD